jgi:hypothetical protein
MPFQKDDEKTKQWASQGGIAKAAIYELDRMQLDKMRKALDKDLDLVIKVQESESIDPLDKKKLQITKDRVQKYSDKLHSTKTETEVSGSLILSMENEVQDKYANGNPENSIEGQPPL